jgi:hypothetical protein
MEIRVWYKFLTSRCPKEISSNRRYHNLPTTPTDQSIGYGAYVVRLAKRAVAIVGLQH